MQTPSITPSVENLALSLRGKIAEGIMNGAALNKPLCVEGNHSIHWYVPDGDRDIEVLFIYKRKDGYEYIGTIMDVCQQMAEKILQENKEASQS